MSTGPYDLAQRPPLQDEQRFAALRRLLHDHDIGLRERFAGSVLLLYAQPLTRIAQLGTGDITTADGGEVALTFARGAIVLPEPLASIAPFDPNASPTANTTAGCSRAASAAPTSPPSTCASAWRPTASPVAPVATAHCWRWPAGSPHRSSPNDSASTKPAQRNGRAPPAPPTPPTSGSARNGARAMDEWREQAFHGGRQTVGITRIGDTVRRPRHARSDLVHAVLRHLEAAGFDGAPCLLGIDEHGREVLTYIDGKTIDSSPVSLSDGRLVSAAQLIRRFHDTTAGTALVQTGRREPSPISALNCRCRRAVEASGRWSLPYAAPAWRGGQPALGVA
jgi:hypothetical protein